MRTLASLADFIESHLEFLPPADRAAYGDAVREARAGKIKLERLFSLAKNLGAAIWSARRALARFLEIAGAELEWEKVVEHVRPATALLLKRLRKNSGATNLAETLKSPDAAFTISPEQEIEIDMVREEARFDLWNKHREHLKEMISEAARELEAMKKRFKVLQGEALQAEGAERESLLDRLAALEDRVYFGGEAIPLEVLDAEIKFDAEEIGVV